MAVNVAGLPFTYQLSAAITQNAPETTWLP
jgi:hypothetical protein